MHHQKHKNADKILKRLDSYIKQIINRHIGYVCIELLLISPSIENDEEEKKRIKYNTLDTCVAVLVQNATIEIYKYLHKFNRKNISE